MCVAILSDVTETGRRAEPDGKCWINSFITIVWDVARLLKSAGSPVVSYVVQEEKRFGSWSQGGPVCILALLGHPSSCPQAPSCLQVTPVLRTVGVGSVRRRDGVHARRDCRAGFLAGLAAFQRTAPPVPGPWGAVAGTPAETRVRARCGHRAPLLPWAPRLGSVAASPAQLRGLPVVCDPPSAGGVMGAMLQLSLVLGSRREQGGKDGVRAPS